MSLLETTRARMGEMGWVWIRYRPSQVVYSSRSAIMADIDAPTNEHPSAKRQRIDQSVGAVTLNEADKDRAGQRVWSGYRWEGQLQFSIKAGLKDKTQFWPKTMKRTEAKGAGLFFGDYDELYKAVVERTPEGCGIAVGVQILINELKKANGVEVQEVQTAPAVQATPRTNHNQGNAVTPTTNTAASGTAAAAPNASGIGATTSPSASRTSGSRAEAMPETPVRQLLSKLNEHYVAKSDGEKASLGTKVQNLEVEIEELKQLISEKGTELSEKDTKLSEKERELENKSTELDRKDAETSRLKLQIGQLRRQINPPQPEEAVEAAIKLLDPDGKLRPVVEGMIDSSTTVFADVVGLEGPKTRIENEVKKPLLNPTLRCYRNLLPLRGLLLYGPPGTGKTFFASSIANEVGATFIKVCLSGLTSKWHGESEKIVKLVYCIARVLKPTIVFVDECERLCGSRDSGDADDYSNMKQVLLTEMDNKEANKQVVTIGATNYPDKLDGAFCRRFGHFYEVSLPSDSAREQYFEKKLNNDGGQFFNDHDLTKEQVARLAEMTDGYSGDDLQRVCDSATVARTKDFSPNQIQALTDSGLRKVNFDDFASSIREQPSTVREDDLRRISTFSCQRGNH